MGQDEICPNGHQGGEVPRDGFSQHAENWVPTADSYNSWLCTADKDWSCRLVNEVTQHPEWKEDHGPSWGLTNNPISWRRDVCCTAQMTWARDVANTMTYQDAVRYCGDRNGR